MIKRIVALALFASVVLVGIYAILTVYDNNMRFGRMWETPVIRPREEPIPAMADGVVPFSGGEEILRATPDKELKPPFEEVTEEIIAAGKTQYQYYCVMCHGKNYDGMGTVGQSFAPLPADLRSPAVQDMPAAYMFRTISYGIPGGRQPALHGTITSADRWRIVAFVKSLGIRQPQ
ncbi:MAG: c-type cytochrome [Desulfobacterales bacterium]|nr:c-type cytochrome [Desulfobacterales bacterium]